MDIKYWVSDSQSFHPAVLVASTPAADNICAGKNGLSLVDVFRPYSHIPQLNVPMRIGETASPIRVQDLKVCFYSAPTMFQPKTEVIEDYLKDVLQASAHKYAKMEPHADLLQVMQSDHPVGVQELTPWFTEYREEFFRLLSFSEHEALDHPVACILVVPADVPNPTSHFEALLAQMALPPLMQQDVMLPVKDRDFPKHYLLIQDGATMEDRKALDNLAAIRKAFGDAHCSLLKINTGSGDKTSMGATPDFFRKFHRRAPAGGGAGEPESRPVPPPQGLGAYLSVTDLDGIANVIREFATRTLLPKLEERMARLNAGINATRRGLRNQFKRLWKGVADDQVNEKAYPWHSIESQMRQLGDLAFFLRQYDFAASMYRLAAQDYLNNNSFKWYAGVEEMVGLCCIMEPSDGNDPVKYFTRAYDNYVKVPGKQARMLATRAMLLRAAYEQASGAHLMASRALMRAHFEEENARAALLLEQSAYALLYLRPPSARKFAFQMVLAGLRYNSCGQKRLAIHAYRQVVGLYHGKRWRSIEEHLNDILGRQCRELGEDARASWHFMHLLDSCQHRPAATQQHYLAQFVDAVKRVQTKQEFPYMLENLGLPLVNRSDIQVVYNDQYCYASQAAYQVQDGAWTKLEACFSELGSAAASSNWLLEAGSGAKQERDHEEYNTAVVGEEIAVNVEFRNPLHVKLRVSAVRLVCEFTPTDADATPVALPRSDSLDQGGSSSSHPLSGEGPVRPTNELLHIVDDRFGLHPGEVLVEQLRVTPRVPGWLRITGVTWLLNDTVEGRANFAVKGRHRKRPKGSRPSQQKHYPPGRRLLFSVVGAMPRLELSAEAMPSAMYQGEVARYRLAVRNVGGLPLRNLQMVLGHPEVAAAAGSGALSTLAALHAPSSESIHLSPAPLVAKKGAQLYKLWPGLELGPGERQEWVLWLNPRGTGSLKFQGVWYYEPCKGSSGPAPMRYRTLRMAFAIQVQPLLLLRAVASPSYHDLYSYSLRLDLELGKESEAVSVRQLSCMTAGTDQGWRLAPAASNQASAATAAIMPCLDLAGARHSVQMDTALQPGGSSTVYYQLLPPAVFRAAAAGQQPVLTEGPSAAGEEGEEEEGPGSSNSSVFGGSSRTASTAALDGTGTSIVGSAGYTVPASGSAPQLSGAQGSLQRASVNRWQPGDPPQLSFFDGGVLGHFYGPAAPAHVPHVRHRRGPGAVEKTPGPPEYIRTPGRVVGPGHAGPGPAAPGASDPPVDIVLMWQVSSGQQVAGPGQERERVGFIRVRDVGTMTKMPPVRTLLAGQSAVQHDFRQNVMCITPLRLLLRNCSAAFAKLQIEAGDGWQAPEPQNAWQVSATPLGQQPAPMPLAPPPPPSAPNMGMGMGMVPPPPPSPGYPSLSQAAGGGSLGPPATAATASPLLPSTPITYQAGLVPSSEYVWCGHSSVGVEALPPGGAMEVQLQLAVFRPGTYAVTGPRCSYTIEAAGVSSSLRGEQLQLRVESA